MKLPTFTKAQIRLALYIGSNTASVALAGLKLSMFGDGSYSWAQFRFAWVMFFIGLGGSTFIAVRSFIDSSNANQP